MNTNDRMIKELQGYSKDFLENLLLDQHSLENYINKWCMDCKNHRCIIFDNRDFHICNDDWSSMSVGEHIFYCETRDICTECNGFKRR
jgi:hypothetical protein